MVKSEKLYTPQSYVEALTGNCYVFGSDNVCEQISNVMLFNKLNIKRIAKHTCSRTNKLGE